MKNLLVFLLGAVVGALGFWYYSHGDLRHVTPVSVVDKTQPAPQETPPTTKTHHSGTSATTAHTPAHTSTPTPAHTESPAPKHDSISSPTVATKAPETSATLTVTATPQPSPSPATPPPSVTFAIPPRPQSELPAVVVTATVAPSASNTPSQSPASAATTVSKPIETQTGELIDTVSEYAMTMAGTIKNKLLEWNLTPADIKKDLASAGTVVREKSKIAGAAISNTVTNTRIITIIKTKYALDRDLSKESVHVECNEGAVTLSGSTSSLILIGRAMALALDTDGVSGVTSQLTLTSATR